MIDTLAHTDTEVYDEFNRRRIPNKRRRRRRFPRRRPPMKFNVKGFPIKVKIPTKKHPKIVKGRPRKLPPITDFNKSMNTGVMKPKPRVKTLLVKQKNSTPPKKKIGIDQLIKKTNIKKANQKEALPPTTKVNAQDTSSGVNKAMESDNKVGKIIKIVTGIAILGGTGYGIYKYIQYRKKKGSPLKK